MNNIPNGGFPPLKLKKKEINNKERGFFKKNQTNINIRQILLNSTKKKILSNENKDDNLLQEVTNL
jgi:hypothetical protein